MPSTRRLTFCTFHVANTWILQVRRRQSPGRCRAGTREYLGLPPAADQKRLGSNLPLSVLLDRPFIGTNSKDYTVAAGWSARVVGPFSDGLVRMNNATLFGPSDDPQNPVILAPRAYVHRSHSGYYGIVNSEEGYQNLTRFLFGDARVE
jgi:hypothetical protein